MMMIKVGKCSLMHVFGDGCFYLAFSSVGKIQLGGMTGEKRKKYMQGWEEAVRQAGKFGWAFGAGY